MLPNLIELGPGLYTLIQPEPAYGNSNLGLIVDADGASTIDTGATPEAGSHAYNEFKTLLAVSDLAIKRCVITSSRVPFTGGSSSFVELAFYGSTETSNELDGPVNPLAIQRLIPHLASSYPPDFTTRPITHEIAGPAWITPSTEAIVVGGESAQNLVAYSPSAGVAFAGGFASFGVTPLAYAGDPAAWAANLESLSRLAQMVVPGHGNIGGEAEMLEQAAYLSACCSAASSGQPIEPGPWEAWSNREFDEINIERAARLAQGDQSIPTSFLDLLGFS